MISIDDVVRADREYSEKIAKKKEELEGSISSEIEKAKKAVEAAKRDASKEEKKAEQLGLAEGKEAGKKVRASYAAKIRKLESAYKKNKERAIKRILDTVLEG